MINLYFLLLRQCDHLILWVSEESDHNLLSQWKRKTKITNIIHIAIWDTTESSVHTENRKKIHWECYCSKPLGNLGNLTKHQCTARTNSQRHTAHILHMQCQELCIQYWLVQLLDTSSQCVHITYYVHALWVSWNFSVSIVQYKLALELSFNS